MTKFDFFSEIIRTPGYISVVDFTKSCKSTISRKCEFQPIKSLEITLTIILTINLRLTTFCEIDPCILRNIDYC